MIPASSMSSSLPRHPADPALFPAIAYEGALANVNAFDQPGVEDYKKILHEDLRKYILENRVIKLFFSFFKLIGEMLFDGLTAEILSTCYNND